MAVRDKPDLEHGIYRVLHTLVVGGLRMKCESDLIFQNDQPFVVLEWGGQLERQYPAVKLELNPTLLERNPSMAGYFLYSGQLVDPRKAH